MPRAIAKNHASQTVAALYEEYAVSEDLARHMLRVAAIAETIAEGWTGPALDRRALRRCTIIHDIGGVVSGSPRPDRPARVIELAAESEGDRQRARAIIAGRMGYSDAEQELFVRLTMVQTLRNLQELNHTALIATYAHVRDSDDTVMPLDAARTSTLARHPEFWSDPLRREALEAMDEVEALIEGHCTVPMDSITESRIAPTMARLRLAEI